jgi:plastocyanin
MERPERRDRWVAMLTLAGAVALSASACASASPAASTPATATSTVPTAAPSVAAVASPSRAPASTPIPTLTSTTEAATVAPSGAVSIKMTEDAGPRFAPDVVTAKAGTVAFFLTNVLNTDAGPIDHSMAIGPELHKPLAGSTFIHVENSAVFTVEGLTPGTYRFWCQVQDHAAKGMVGTLTITP